jgi:hypothetical protein
VPQPLRYHVPPHTRQWFVNMHHSRIPSLESQICKTISYLYLCVPYGSHNKQRLFQPNSINRLVSVAETQCVSCEVRTVSVCSVWFSQ